MLKNKLFLIGLGIALILALIYNISFFAGRRSAQSSGSLTHSGAVALASLPPHGTDDGTGKGGTIFAPVVKPVKMVDRLKSLALDSRPWGRNPFLTGEEEFSLQAQYATGERERENGATTINGILIGTNRRIAIIDRTIVGEGDWIGPEQVVEIDGNEAILALGRNRRAIAMKAPPIAITVEKHEDSEREHEN